MSCSRSVCVGGWYWSCEREGDGEKDYRVGIEGEHCGLAIANGVLS